MRCYEANCLDGDNLVGFGPLNADHAAYIELRENDDEKMEHMKGMYKTSPESFDEWKEWCMSAHILTDIFGTLDDPKDFDEEKLFAED